MEKRLKRHLPNGTFMDVPVVRSAIMSAIKGKNNKSTEIPIRMALVRSGITGWIMHAKEIQGNPDFYFPQKRIAVFVNGCFWHGCSKCGHIPKTRTFFWNAKIRRNIQRANKNIRSLRTDGVKVFTIWEHELGKNAGNNPAAMQRLLHELKQR